MPGKWFLVGMAALTIGARGICQTGAYPLAGVQKPSTPPTLLTAMPHSGEEVSGPGAVRWNAGIIPGDKASIEHTFTLKNTTAHAITVNRLHGSCGCETLFLSKGGAEATAATLAPGETTEVRISVALHPGQSGEMHKYAWAYGPNANVPALASMEIVLTVRPAIVYEPEVLDFGTLLVGDIKTVTVRATVETSVLAGKPLPTPVGSSAAIVVTPDGPETAVVHAGLPARTRRFRVMLAAPAEAGPVSGSVSLPTTAPPALAAVNVPLAGTISGTLTAQPRSVFFGSIPVGQGVVREVMLSQSAAQHGKALSVTSGSPWLVVTVQETAGINPVLTLSLKPDAPIGPVQTQAVILSASGERLTVPVVGEVVGHGP